MTPTPYYNLVPRDPMENVRRRIACRERAEVIREEIAARQAVLDALTRAKEQPGKNGKASG